MSSTMNVESLEILPLIKDSAQFFREENARLEEILRRLKILNNEEQRIPVDIAVKVAEIKDDLLGMRIFKTKNQAERLRKHNNYLSKLKTCIRVYATINERLSEDIKTARRELDHSKSKVANISKVISREQLQQLEEKAKRYENEVNKFVKKYPWLNDPSIDLPNISKEVQKLRVLKDTKEKLLTELNVYQGLKPDFDEAHQQLIYLKEEHKKFSCIL